MRRHGCLSSERYAIRAAEAGIQVLAVLIGLSNAVYVHGQQCRLYKPGFNVEQTVSNMSV